MSTLPFTTRTSLRFIPVPLSSPCPTRHRAVFGKVQRVLNSLDSILEGEKTKPVAGLQRHPLINPIFLSNRAAIVI